MNILMLVEAGQIKENNNVLGVIQNISREHAHGVCKWLVLATGQRAHVRYTTFDGTEDIRYMPEGVVPVTEETPSQ